MSAARKQLQENSPETMARTAEEMQQVLESFDKRWDLMHNRLHSVGFVLGPSNHADNTWDGQTWTETLEYIKQHYGPASPQATAALNQLLMYKRKAGPFAEEAIFDIAKDFSPVQWWELHGTQAKELMEVAVRVLSQVWKLVTLLPCGSSDVACLLAGLCMVWVLRSVHGRSSASSMIGDATG